MEKWDCMKLKSSAQQKKRVRGNICWLYIWQRTDNQNIQKAQKTKLPQNQWTNNELDNWTKQIFFKERNPNGQKTHEKMLTISGYKGNAN
jgi:hypothetical protein